MSESGTLWYEHREGESLSTSLNAYETHLEGGTALLYSPSACLLARVQSGRLRGAEGVALDLDAIFEARVFTKDAELRWLRTPGGSRTVLVREEAPAATDADATAPAVDGRHPFHGTIDQSYILWGEALADAAAGDWASLATARIGTMQVPLPADKGLPPNGRMAIRAREYLFTDDTHGNAYVGDERLLALEVL